MAEVGGKRPRDGPRVKNDRVCVCFITNERGVERIMINGCKELYYCCLGSLMLKNTSPHRFYLEEIS